MSEPIAGNPRPTILIVDDSPDNISLISSILKREYTTKGATSGVGALDIVSRGDRLDLVLLDVVMAEMDGYEVCRRLKGDPATSDIPVIFLTAKSDTEDEQRGFELGAVDYITKPVSPSLVLARVRTHLQLKAARDFLRDKSRYLEEEVARRTREITAIQNVTMVAMGSLAETRDNETGAHIRRTQLYVKVLADEARHHVDFGDPLPGNSVDLLQKSAPLHDIGKVGIPDRILLKPGPLTVGEFEVMKTHTTIGYRSILAAERQLGSAHSFLSVAREIAWTHHEKWDGTGYPRGLSGEGIPVAGRIMALADVYDALVSRRVYKTAVAHDVAIGSIRAASGTHFDPRLVEVFLDIAENIRGIAREHADAQAARSS